MQFSALVVAAGRGLRAGGGVPKQYRDLAGRPVLRRTVECFLAHPGLGRLCLVIHPDDAGLCADALGGLEDERIMPPVPGGDTRQASVRAGLEALALAPGVPPFVLIHDAARPFVTGDVIDGVLEGLSAHPGAFPALPVVDALWRGSEGLAGEPQPRGGLWRAQTPQGFRLGDILAAHRAHPGAADDDVAIARRAGLTVAVTRGAEGNFKLTDAQDFQRAEAGLGRQVEYRTGQGFDVHRFRDGDHVTLGGVRIPHDRGLDAHSDGDVVLHALTDALFGAIVEGDIGQWFPSSDPQWRGAASTVFLGKAAERVAARGGRVTHCDCTVICERPRVAAHAPAMRANIAATLGIGADRVSVKATTSERLGFTGRGEGIAAFATATVALA
jgi:2-C-methyl-D-erythritol 4-phosphate cytidylyltransferase/2-C-methyl-D-erythritol 2,4-cyclodiphosphate synthase